MAPPGRPCGRPRKSGSSTTSSTRTSDPLGAFPAPPMIASSFVDSAYGSQPQSQAYNEPHKNDNRTQRVALKPTSPVQARTPIHKNASPTKQGAARMTVGQKQALIDNLRLEITDRARRLRAQYAQSAASLRRRLEMRIHRVPAALRKLTMGEVIERHEQKLKNDAETKVRRAREAEEEAQRKANLKARKAEAPKKQKQAPPTPKQTRAAKRTSDDAALSDKENNTVTLPNKRARPNTARATSTAAKPASKANATARRAPPSTTATSPPREVLSPKSHNTRSYPASPFKSPAKPAHSRPTSPLKPSGQVSPSKPVTIPANVPSFANVGTASSMAKTKNTTTTKTGTVRSAAAGSTRAASRAAVTNTGTVRSKPTTMRGQKAQKTVVHVDEDVPSVRQTRSSRGRGSGGTDESNLSTATTVVHKTSGKGAAKANIGTVKKKVAEKSVVTGGGRTLRKRA